MTAGAGTPKTGRRARAVAILVVAPLLPGCATGPLEPTRTHPAGAIVASPRLGERPYGVAVSGAGVVLVTRGDAATVSLARLPDPAFTDAVAVRLVPTDVAFNRAGTRAFVTNQHSQQVGVVDVARGLQVDSIVFPGDPFRVLVSADDRTLFVTTNTGYLYRVDLATKRVVAQLLFSAPANGLALDAGGARLYASTIDGTVAEISTASTTWLRTFPVGGMAQGLAVSPDGAELYVADAAGGRLMVWSLASGQPLDSLPLGGLPFDVRMTPDGAQIYVGVRTAGKVLVFDRETRAPRLTLPTGGAPRRIAFDRTGSVAVVANEAGWVDFIR